MNGGENGDDGNKTASAPAFLFLIHNSQKLYEHIHFSVSSLVLIAFFKNFVGKLPTKNILWM